MTGHSNLISAEESRAHGIRSSLAKPVAKYDLARAIRDSIDQASPVR